LWRREDGKKIIFVACLVAETAIFIWNNWNWNFDSQSYEIIQLIVVNVISSVIIPKLNWKFNVEVQEIHVEVDFYQQILLIVGGKKKFDTFARKIWAATTNDDRKYGCWW
jgi:hypothetical protein